VGCAATADSQQAMGCGWTPDPEIHSAHLDNECQKEWCQAPDLKARIRERIELAADYRGVSHEVLPGWKIKIVDLPRVRALAPGSR
jgi:hypothetical protein